MTTLNKTAELAGVGLNVELDAMREAIMQLLDDMGPDGHSVCEAAKQLAIESVHAHYCPDWDYLPICPTDPEADGCTCQAFNNRRTLKWECEFIVPDGFYFAAENVDGSINLFEVKPYFSRQSGNWKSDGNQVCINFSQGQNDSAEYSLTQVQPGERCYVSGEYEI